MSDTVDTRVLQAVRASTPETQEVVLRDLLDLILSAHSDDPALGVVTAAQSLRDALDRLAAGQAYPPPTPEEVAEAERNQEYLQKVLRLTPEDEVESQRRLDTIDDVIDADELIRRLGAGAPIGTS